MKMKARKKRRDQKVRQTISSLRKGIFVPFYHVPRTVRAELAKDNPKHRNMTDGILKEGRQSSRCIHGSYHGKNRLANACNLTAKQIDAGSVSYIQVQLFSKLKLFLHHILFTENKEKYRYEYSYRYKKHIWEFYLLPQSEDKKSQRQITDEMTIGV